MWKFKKKSLNVRNKIMSTKLNAWWCGNYAWYIILRTFRMPPMACIHFTTYFMLWVFLLYYFRPQRVKDVTSSLPYGSLITVNNLIYATHTCIWTFQLEISNTLVWLTPGISNKYNWPKRCQKSILNNSKTHIRSPSKSWIFEVFLVKNCGWFYHEEQ